MDMKVVDTYQSCSIWLFDYPTNLLVQDYDVEEIRSWKSDNYDDLNPTIRALRRVADVVARNIKRRFNCDCHVEQEVLVPTPGKPLVVRLSVVIDYLAQGVLVGSIDAYAETLIEYMKSVLTGKNENLPIENNGIIKAIKSALKQCVSGQESATIHLNLPSGESIKGTLSPELPVVKKIPEKFTGHVWCVNDKASNCRVQVKFSGAKEKNLCLKFNSSSRNFLLESQLRESRLSFEIVPYDQKHDLDGEIVSVVADEPELDYKS